ncbi:MAG: DNA-binding response OmpR family regulator/nitrogen-specific signal transduction histidine kinase [Candidatus Latescibacterota bacterium]|jgi:DNA-binding response OmpR family regulator/nitrogen-specific signal transduction histidine kinase
MNNIDKTKAQLIEELETANAQLQEATRLKSQFLATMSHELRTPMNAIIGFTRLVLRRSDNLADRQRENLEKVKLSADHLLNLINEILALSKIEAGRMDIQPATFDLRKLVANCCATVGPTLGKASVMLDYEVADEAVDVYSDEARLRQIVINLLSNALKFTDEGEVKIKARIQETEDNQSQREMLVISVSDMGIGIPEDQLDMIFEEFRQVDGSSTRKIQGTGLGLAITKKLVGLLGGSIGVTSVEGEGSTFTFCIPARYGDGADTPSDVSAQVVHVVDGNNKLIVSIDDDPNVAVLLRQELEEDGFQVISALNADEGIALVKKHKPVAVTVDILMPGKDGWQTIAALKADETTRDVPVIVVSAIENRELGFSLGIHDYIVKPFDHDALMGSLKRLNPQGMHDILVVEDDPSAADLLCQMLEIDGFASRTAYNGRQAMVQIEEATPDAIFLDLMMPEMDGFEVIERLQAREDWKSIPVIVVTAKDLSLEEVDFLNARVNQVVQKGDLNLDVLENTLKDVLESHSESK